MSQHKNTSLINPFTLATIEPMQRVYMDTIGPINSDSQVIEANDRSSKSFSFSNYIWKLY